MASLFGDFRTGGSHKACRGLGELTPDVRSVLARRGRVETARPRTCCIVLKRYPWGRTAPRRRRTHTDGRSRTSLVTSDCRSSWAPSLRHRSRGSKSAPARTASLLGDFRTGESVASRRPLAVVADLVGGVYVGLVMSCNQEPAAFRLGLAKVRCNVFILVYYSVRPAGGRTCARIYARSPPNGL